MSPVVICQKCGPWAMEALEAISNGETHVSCNGVAVSVDVFLERFKKQHWIINGELCQSLRGALKDWKHDRAFYGRMA